VENCSTVVTTSVKINVILAVATNVIKLQVFRKHALVESMKSKCLLVTPSTEKVAQIPYLLAECPAVKGWNVGIFALGAVMKGAALNAK
jgi:hypothetical protein